MNNTTLNLARKWRSGNFSQIVGQSVSVRILKNSLYLGHYFPVYLFAGQRGCGKTSTARVFAAALNCQKLSDFQKDPQNNDVPCQACDSCVAMINGKHPDFIEVDGASHTGVDNVRNIIEASTLLPVMGTKKIYLIDEAHMLSKASFNAFLKILEEPPAGVLFILATTAPEKIIDTVRSRCFQLFFNAIDTELLCKHLEAICKKENIAYDTDGLKIIVRESEGSARDALNLLEQVRFSSKKITVASVQKVLGHIDDEHVVALLSFALRANAQGLLEYLSKIEIEQYEAQAVWQRLIMYTRALLWCKHGVQPTQKSVQPSLLDDLVQTVSVSQVYSLLQSLYDQEVILSKTKSQHALIEMALLQLCADKKKNNNEGSSSLMSGPSTQEEQLDDEEVIEEKKGTSVVATVNTALEVHDADLATWNAFIQEVTQLHEPLLVSLFSQGTFCGYHATTKTVKVEFGKNLIFFNDTLTSAQAQWAPLIERLFGAGVVLDTHFTGQSKEVERPEPKQASPQVQQLQSAPVTKPAAPKPQHSYQNRQQYAKKPSYTKKTISEVVVDVSDKDKWPTASMLLEVFPGTVTKVNKEL